MQWEIDRQIKAVSAAMWSLYQSKVVKREIPPRGAGEAPLLKLLPP